MSTAKIICETVRTLDFAPIVLPDTTSDAVRFRIEIQRDWETGAYSARAWRLEFYALAPSFPGEAEGGFRADEQIVVRDGFLQRLLDPLSCASEDEIIKEVMNIIEEHFGRGA